MNIEDYTEKSFVVFGETKNFKETLKELGGKYNSNLKVGPGWVFSKSNKDKIEQWLSSVSTTSIPKIKQDEREFSVSKIVNEYSTKIFDIDEDFSLKNMNRYRMAFLNMLIDKKTEISFDEFHKLDIDKIILYSYISWARN